MSAVDLVTGRRGLTSAEAARRLAGEGPNALPVQRRMPAWRLLAAWANASSAASIGSPCGPTAHFSAPLGPMNNVARPAQPSPHTAGVEHDDPPTPTTIPGPRATRGCATFRSPSCTSSPRRRWRGRRRLSGGLGPMAARASEDGQCRPDQGRRTQRRGNDLSGSSR